MFLSTISFQFSDFSLFFLFFYMFFVDKLFKSQSIEASQVAYSSWACFVTLVERAKPLLRNVKSPLKADMRCGKRLPPGIDSPQMSQRKRNSSRQIILTGPLIGLIAWNHSQRFKLNRSQLSWSHDWFTGSTTTTTHRLNLKSQALIVYTEHCMQMAYG